MTVFRTLSRFPRLSYPALLIWFLLPVLFQTLLGFHSALRLWWEAAYLLLSILLVRAAADLWRAGGWRAPLILAALLGALYARNPYLTVTLLVLGWMLWRPMEHRLFRRAGGVAAAILTCAVVLRLAMAAFLALSGAASPTWLVPAPSGGQAQFAEVTVRDPGAMGRVRYHAVEQRELFSLGTFFTISLVTGRDSAPSGTGAYGYVIDWYFSQPQWDQGGK